MGLITHGSGAYRGLRLPRLSRLKAGHMNRTEPHPSAVSPRKSAVAIDPWAWASAPLPLLAYVALAVLFFLPVWLDPQHVVVAFAGLPPGDPQQQIWFLAWGPSALLNGHSIFFTDFLNYPDGANLMWNTSQPLSALALAPITLTWGPVVAYNVLVTGGVALSAWVGYHAIRRLVRDRPAAWLGGLLYGFSPIVLAHARGQTNLVLCLFPPLVLLLGHELLVKRRHSAWAIGLMLGVITAAQVLISEDVLAISMVGGVLGAGILLAVAGRASWPQFRRSVAGLAVAGLSSLTLAAYPLWVQFLGPQRIQGAVHGPDVYVADLLGFVLPNELFWLTPGPAVAVTRSFTGNVADSSVYVGIPLVALLAFVGWRWRDQVLIRWGALTALGIAVLAMGPHLHVAGAVFRIPLPWLLLAKLPLMQHILPGRLMLIFFLMAGVLLSFLVTWVRGQASAARRAVGWALVAAALLPLLPELPPTTANYSTPSFFRSPVEARSLRPGSVALVLPFAVPPTRLGPVGKSSATNAMLWQAETGMRFRMPEGYLRVPDPSSGTSAEGPPPSATQTVLLKIQDGQPTPAVTSELRASLTADLRRWRIETVIVGPMANQEAALELFSSLLGGPPQLEGGIYLWTDVQAALGRVASAD